MIEAKELAFEIAEYIAEHAEGLRTRRVEVDGLMEFVCDEVGLDVAEVNARLKQTNHGA